MLKPCAVVQIDSTLQWRLSRQISVSAKTKTLIDHCCWRGLMLTILRLCPCRSWYFCLHITCILMVMVLPVKSRRRQTKEQQDKQSEHNSTDNNCNQKEKAT